MTVMDQAAPARSHEQRMQALERANRTRTARAELKRHVRAGRLSASEVLVNPPQYAETMRVLDLLLAIPKIGRVKAMRMLNRHSVAPSKTIGGLSARQRGALLAALS
jgi:hypothetical protein